MKSIQEYWDQTLQCMQHELNVSEIKINLCAGPPGPRHALGAVHPHELCQRGRHHRGGRAHQPHRQKALPAGTAGGRHELCAGTGRQSGRGRGTDSGRERGRTRRGRAGADGAGGQGAAKRDQPAPAAGLLQRGGAGAGSAGVQRQAHRQLHQR